MNVKFGEAKPSSKPEVSESNLPGLCGKTISELSLLLKSKEISPVELANEYLTRIEQLDSQVNAFVTLTADRALDQARQAEQEITKGKYRGPLHGIPYGLKDIINTAGVATTGHSEVARTNIPNTDATVHKRMRESGAVFFGKLATHEFAFGGCFDLPWPPARNPWNTDYFTGGSSSGSAAAVAAGFLPAAVGTDTGGSIRTPSSLNGITGLKPTYGLVSRFGVIPNSFSFDHCGPMAWTAEDCAILLQAIAGPDPLDPTSSADDSVPNFRATLGRDLKGVRIGVVRHFWEEDVSAGTDVKRAMEDAIEVLSGLGAVVADVRLRPAQDYYDVKMVIAETELLTVHHNDVVERPQDFGPEFLTRSLPACLFQGLEYVQAQRERRVMIREARELFEKFDCLVTVSPGPAPKLASFRRGDATGLSPGVVGANIDFWKRPSLTTPFNLLGIPAISVRSGFTAEGMPLGMQIAASWFDEATVFRVAAAYENASPWRTRRPVLRPNDTHTALPPAGPIGDLPEADEEIRRIVEVAVQRAGLHLTTRQFAELCQAAPYALAMAQRIGRKRERTDEPAYGFLVDRHLL